MGMFNNYGDYNVEDEAARRKASMEIFLNSDDTHLLMIDEEKQPFAEVDFAKVEIRAIAKSTVKIKDNGGFFSADCPNCGKTKILGSELNSLSAVCNKCYCPFLLEK